MAFSKSVDEAHSGLATSNRSQDDIFLDLRHLCGSPGYVHALAFLCFRDNFIPVGDEVNADDMQHLFSHERLIRTEIATLLGLLVCSQIDFDHPGSDILIEYVHQTEALLKELHRSMSAVMFDSLVDEAAPPMSRDKPRLIGELLREPIFYGGESAYQFQYLDLAAKKYGDDGPWFMENLGFDIQDCCKVVAAIPSIQDRSLRNVFKNLEADDSNYWAILPGFMFTAEEVAEHIGASARKVERVLDAFTFQNEKENTNFNSLQSYNIVNGTPLIRKDDNKYILLHQYMLFEALYESPFYWLGADTKYKSTAFLNRGRYTENFSFGRLERVFGESQVYRNVDVWRNNKLKLCEIDVLVIFGNRVIVLQAKSKRLTLEARKGNDLQIKDDFKKAVQDSYDQAWLCSEALVNSKPEVTDAAGNPVKLPDKVKMVYPVCIVADHYPALSFQARQFLETQSSSGIAEPLVTDVFALDAMTEMLESPLRLLSYLELRSRFGGRLTATHELTFLSYHLKYNLWLNDRYDFVALHDDIAADLDIAMAARRDGLPGARTPDGILTRVKGTAVERIIGEIEAAPDSSVIDIGFLLLEMGEDTVLTLTRGVREIVRSTGTDGKKHDITIGLGESSVGLTIHCNPDGRASAEHDLRSHCVARKYAQKADRWLGLALKPGGSVWFGLNLEYPWAQDWRMDVLERQWPKAERRQFDLSNRKPSRKIGRNASCPCGSGKKYKKCCMPSQN